MVRLVWLGSFTNGKGGTNEHRLAWRTDISLYLWF
jgi:hypothetical protein